MKKYQFEKQTRQYLLVNWYCKKMYGTDAEQTIDILADNINIDWEAALIRLLVKARAYVQMYVQDTCVTTAVRTAEKKRLYKKCARPSVCARYIMRKREAFLAYQYK